MYSSRTSARPTGFTLIELMIVIAIIGILATIAIPNFSRMIRKSKEGATVGGLGYIRSALSVYYGHCENVYPTTIDILPSERDFIDAIPKMQTPTYHLDTTASINETSPTDSGLWSYNGDATDPFWGNVHVGCLHSDLFGRTWSTF